VAGQVYSVRFLWGRSSSRIQTFTVEAGRRAVVRFASVLAFAETGAYCALQVAETPAVYFVSTGPNESAFWDLRLTAYPGETIRVVTGGGDLAWHIAGFYFADDGGRPPDPVDTARDIVSPMPVEPRAFSGP